MAGIIESIRSFLIIIFAFLYMGFKAVTLLPGTVIGEIRDGFESEFAAVGGYEVKGNAAKGLARLYSADENAPETEYDLYKIAWDDRYITVMRKPPKGASAVGYSQDKPYFIIDAAEYKMYGGYSEKELKEKRKELSLPENAKLKRVSRIKNSYRLKSVSFQNGYVLTRSGYNHIALYSDYGENLVTDGFVSETATFDKYLLLKRNDLKRAYENARNDYMIPDEESYEYYIIDTETGEVRGGFDKKGFEEKRKELNIPKRVKLKSIDSYK